ncbi:MAG: DEAD/DEAH box helicase family protein [Oscillospiraceae bacterium]|nr:DEAD/DEAH box helicase family protein [Oscillospiraceae bacterium]
MDQLSIFSELLSLLQKEDDTAAVKGKGKATGVEKALRDREQVRKQLEEKRRRKEEEQRQQALEQERIRQVTSMELPMDWENAFAASPAVRGVHAADAADGLILSLSNLARVDIEYIASVTGSDCKSVICALKGSIYQNPETWEECFYKGWETAEQYLSGNLRRKWLAAKEADRTYMGYFQDNIHALETLLPDMVSSQDIYITLGSPWVPVEVIDAFVTHMLGLKTPYRGTKHDELTGTWELPGKHDYLHSRTVAANHTFGTSKLGALQILEKTLNMKTVCVMRPVPGDEKKRVVDRAETVLALEKQQKMIREFRAWVWNDHSRKVLLEDIFDRKFGCVRRRNFDGSFLKFPGMSSEVMLYPYQKNAVARILFSPNTLLAHEVGSGKTYIMIAAGMEARRMGLSHKHLYVVPNNLVGQWRDTFLLLYPEAKLLCIGPSQFTPAKRTAVLEKIRDESYDGIIMAASCFEQIKLSKSFYMDQLTVTKADIERIAAKAEKSTSGLKRKKDKVEEALAELVTAQISEAEGICFEDLGIDRLFVDEAHNYKNVPIETKVDKVLGISATGSKKCRDMMNKVHYVQKTHDGGGVVMATGTPITNSITDAYIMQSYLQSGELAMLDLQSFDSWIGMFAERVTEFEIDVDTSGYRLATRFAKFHNLPELTVLLSSIADFHQADETADLPQTDGYSDALLSKTEAFDEYLKEISSRAELVRAGMVPRTEDNMLKITTDGRKAALDLRLVDPDAGFTYCSKVMRCAENVFHIYRTTAASRSTQLVFCDTSTPKTGFNIYDDLRGTLIAMGVQPEEIAFIHDAESEKRRQALFAKVRSGEIRVLIGSTFKLGLGVNIQDKLIALHHLDVPWRPADMTQREGRILRQGNENKQVKIFRYITEGSFDAYSWQLLETKQRFICDLLSGSMAARSGSDIESTVLSYAEVKALAVGDPLVKERVETANLLTRYQALQRKAVEKRLSLEQEKLELPGAIAHQQELIEKCAGDMQAYACARAEHDKDTRRQLRRLLYGAVKEHVLMHKEETLMTYQGFDIILPANMTVQEPYIWLQRRGRYRVELGDSEVGALIRVDNCLQELPKHLEMLERNLDGLLARQQDVQKELDKGEDHTEQIESCKRKLEQLDKRLGAKK